MLTILSNIVALATVGSINSTVLSAMVDLGHKTDNDTLKVALQGAHALTDAALSAALAPFGVKGNDKVPGSESSYVHDGRTVTYSMDYATGARVFGAKLVEGR